MSRLTAEEVDAIVVESQRRADEARASLERMTPGAGELLDNYGAELRRHGLETPAEVAEVNIFGDPVTRYAGRCSCGWQQERAVCKRAVANRAAGLHSSAAYRRASRTFDSALDELRNAQRGIAR